MNAIPTAAAPIKIEHFNKGGRALIKRYHHASGAILTTTPQLKAREPRAIPASCICISVPTSRQQAASMLREWRRGGAA